MFMADITLGSRRGWAPSRRAVSAVALIGRVAAFERAPQSNHVDPKTRQRHGGLLVKGQSEQQVDDLEHRATTLQRSGARGSQEAANPLTANDPASIVISFDPRLACASATFQGQWLALLIPTVLHGPSQLLVVDSEAGERRGVGEIGDPSQKVEHV